MNKNNTILIVEDEMIIAANISLQLTHLGYEVTGIIPRAEEVLPHIRLHVPDILLLDINLKGDIDGIQLAHLIQKEFNVKQLSVGVSKPHAVKNAENIQVIANRSGSLC